MTAVTVLGPQGYSRPPYGSFAGKPPSPSSTVGTVYYIFQFPSIAAAESDATVGALSFAEVLVFGDITRNSVVANSGFWCRVIRINQPTMLGHPNLQLAFTLNRTVLFTKIPTVHVGIVVSNFYNFVINGLQ